MRGVIYARYSSDNQREESSVVLPDNTKSRDYSRPLVYFFCRILRMLFSDRWYFRLSAVIPDPSA